MLKPFYLNNDFHFDFKGNCTYKGTAISKLEDEIEINVYGKNMTFDRKHIGMYTHFRMNPLQIPFENVIFAPVASKVMRFVCGHLPIFKESVEVGYGFRVIPGFSNFAISEQGNVLSYRTGNILSESLNPYGYRVVNIFDPDKESWRQVTLHLLLARAFIENDDPSNRFYVNHKDGNKLNIALSNLEWSSPKENVMHAVKTGLANLSGLELGRKNIPITVHDLLTGEKFDYETISQAVEAKKISKNWSGETKTVNGISYPRVYYKRYVITEKGQPLPTENLWSNGLPGSKVPNKGPYQALEISTGLVIDCDMIKELVMATGVPYHHVTAILDSETPKKSHGYYFRTASLLPWPTEYSDLLQLTRRSFKITDKESGQETVFDSLASITEFLSVADSTVLKFIRNERIHPVYKIEEITESL